MALCEFVETKEFDHSFSTIQLGQHGCGKSAFLVRFADDTFQTKFMLINDMKMKNIKFEEEIIRLLMWDEPVGKERFRTISTSYYRMAKGIFVVFDVTDLSSFEYVGNYLRDMMDDPNINKDVAKLLIGNKSDLKEQRVVSTKQAQQFADKWNMEYIETSAKTGENVHQSVLMMVKKMMMTKKKQATNELTQPEL